MLVRSARARAAGRGLVHGKDDLARGSPARERGDGGARFGEGERGADARRDLPRAPLGDEARERLAERRGPAARVRAPVEADERRVLYEEQVRL